MKIVNKCQIFVIDDDPFFGTIIKSTLEKNSKFQVTVFTNPQKFLQSLSLNPDLVIIDYDIPDTNGIEVLKSVKNINSKLISLIFSGQKKLSVIIDAYKHGADSYVIKNRKALTELSRNVKAFLNHCH